MVRTKQTARKATGGRFLLPCETHTPPVEENGEVKGRCREDCSLSLMLCRALREMRLRPCPFISVQTIHEEERCKAEVKIPTRRTGRFSTVTAYGSNDEEAYRKAMVSALNMVASKEEAGNTVLRYLPTNEIDYTWENRREELQDRDGSRPMVACMDYARELRGMYNREAGRRRFYFDRYVEASTRAEELEARLQQLQQRLAQYEPPLPAAEDPMESSEPEEVEMEEDSVTTGHSAA